jgi:hypothetical protein
MLQQNIISEKLRGIMGQGMEVLDVDAPGAREPVSMRELVARMSSERMGVQDSVSGSKSMATVAVSGRELESVKISQGYSAHADKGYSAHMHTQHTNTSSTPSSYIPSTSSGTAATTAHHQQQHSTVTGTGTPSMQNLTNVSLYGTSSGRYTSEWGLIPALPWQIQETDAALSHQQAGSAHTRTTGMEVLRTDSDSAHAQDGAHVSGARSGAIVNVNNNNNNNQTVSVNMGHAVAGSAFSIPLRVHSNSPRDDHDDQAVVAQVLPIADKDHVPTQNQNTPESENVFLRNHSREFDPHKAHRQGATQTQSSGTNVAASAQQRTSHITASGQNTDGSHASTTTTTNVSVSGVPGASLSVLEAYSHESASKSATNESLFMHSDSDDAGEVRDRSASAYAGLSSSSSASASASIHTSFSNENVFLRARSDDSDSITASARHTHAAGGGIYVHAEAPQKDHQQFARAKSADETAARAHVHNSSSSGSSSGGHVFSSVDETIARMQNVFARVDKKVARVHSEFAHVHKELAHLHTAFERGERTYQDVDVSQGGERHNSEDAAAVGPPVHPRSPRSGDVLVAGAFVGGGNTREDAGVHGESMSLSVRHDENLVRGDVSGQNHGQNDQKVVVGNRGDDIHSNDSDNDTQTQANSFIPIQPSAYPHHHADNVSPDNGGSNESDHRASQNYGESDRDEFVKGPRSRGDGAASVEDVTRRTFEVPAAERRPMSHVPVVAVVCMFVCMCVCK